MVFSRDAERRHSVIHGRRERSQRWSRLDAHPKNARRFRTGKETAASNVHFDRIGFDRLQRLFDLIHILRRGFSDELQRDVQRFRTHPARVRGKPTYSIQEAGNTLADVLVDIECDEDAHNKSSSIVNHIDHCRGRPKPFEIRVRLILDGSWEGGQWSDQEIGSELPVIEELSRFEKVLRLLVLDTAHLLRFLDGPLSFLWFACSESFKSRSTESIVLQLRVVAGAPKKPSISPRYPIVLMWRR